MWYREIVLGAHCDKRRPDGTCHKMSWWPDQDNNGMDGEGQESTESRAFRTVTLHTGCTLVAPGELFKQSQSLGLPPDQLNQVLSVE